MYLGRQKKGEKLKAYFTKYYKYLACYQWEIAITYAKPQADKLKPVIPDSVIVQNKNSFIKEKSVGVCH